MRELSSHIQHLLAENDLVTLPGFGALVAAPAACRREGDWLLPPSRSVVFNPALRHNDGLLATSYMRSRGCSFTEANRLAESAVGRMANILSQGGSVRINGVGEFRATDGHTFFEPVPEGIPSLSAFGLTPVRFPAFSPAALPDEPAADLRQTAHEKGMRYSLYRASAVAATLLLLLLPAGLHDSAPDINTAGWSPSPARAEAIVTAGPADSARTETGSDSGTLEDDAEPDTPYHLIIGSFKTRSQALKLTQAVPAAWQPYLIYADGRYRVAVASFATEAEGDEYLDRFTAAQPAYRDAWILTLHGEP